MSDLPLFKTTQGCENIRLKARISELEFTVEAISRMAFDAITRCDTTSANIYLKQINEELKVLAHTPRESLLLHDAAVLEAFMQKDWMDSGHDLKTVYRLRDEIAKLRKQAEED